MHLACEGEGWSVCNVHHERMRAPFRADLGSLPPSLPLLSQQTIDLFTTESTLESSQGTVGCIEIGLINFSAP